MSKLVPTAFGSGLVLAFGFGVTSCAPALECGVGTSEVDGQCVALPDDEPESDAGRADTDAGGQPSDDGGPSTGDDAGVNPGDDGGVNPGADLDQDGVVASSDCNDLDENVYQTVAAYEDEDLDGYGEDPLTNVCAGADLPAGWSDAAGDCAPTHPAVHPGAAVAKGTSRTRSTSRRPSTGSRVTSSSRTQAPRSASLAPACRSARFAGRHRVPRERPGAQRNAGRTLRFSRAPSAVRAPHNLNGAPVLEGLRHRRPETPCRRPEVARRPRRERAFSGRGP